MRSHNSFFLILATLALAACASGNSNNGTTRSNPNEIDSAELVGVYSTMSVYDAIGRLRPTWFRSRAGEDEPTARVDNQNYNMGYLRSLPAEDVSTLKFVNRRDATFRFGGRWGGGVIEVTTLRR
jgi:hypothetical protein